MAHDIKLNITILPILITALTIITTPLNSQAEAINQNQTSIIVSATGKAQAMPDMALLNLAIVTQDKSAQLAMGNNAKQMNSVIDYFKSAGVDLRDLQTSSLQIYKNEPDKSYSQKNESPYQVSNALTIRIRNLDNLGKFYDQAIKLGINSVNGISYTNADTKPFYKQARKAAVEEAIDKATILAQAANVKLGSVLQIDETNNSDSPTMRMMMDAKASNYSDTQFATGELNYEVNVTVKFAILN